MHDIEANATTTLRFAIYQMKQIRNMMNETLYH